MFWRGEMEVIGAVLGLGVLAQIVVNWMNHERLKQLEAIVNQMSGRIDDVSRQAAAMQVEIDKVQLIGVEVNGV